MTLLVFHVQPQDSNSVNSVQLIILAIEGGLISMIAIIIIAIVSTQVCKAVAVALQAAGLTCRLRSQLVFRRYSIFTIFMLVPTGVCIAAAAFSCGSYLLLLL